MEHIESTDLFRSAVIISQGGELEKISIRNNGKPIGVIRIKGKGVIKLERKYRSGSSMVEPLRLREVLNYLRDQLFQELRKYEGRLKNDKARNYRCNKKIR